MIKVIDNSARDVGFLPVRAPWLKACSAVLLNLRQLCVGKLLDEPVSFASGCYTSRAMARANWDRARNRLPIPARGLVEDFRFHGTLGLAFLKLALEDNHEASASFVGAVLRGVTLVRESFACEASAISLRNFAFNRKNIFHIPVIALEPKGECRRGRQ